LIGSSGLALWAETWNKDYLAIVGRSLDSVRGHYSKGDNRN